MRYEKFFHQDVLYTTNFTRFNLTRYFLLDDIIFVPYKTIYLIKMALTYE